MKLSQFLKEDNGHFSSARLFAFGLTLGFLGDYTAHIWRNVEFDPSLTVVGAVLGAIGAKVAQKFGENSDDKPQ